ncbi:hypothetical protein JL722_2384 [Aureococcus anophagefferens]|nr:hypothetical protein JL722_2384 [Aureococcus anophagefferens]
MRLDHYYIPSTITRLWRRRETVRLERFIIETLQDATADELNSLLRRVKLGLLVYKLKDEGGSVSREAGTEDNWRKRSPSYYWTSSREARGARTELVDLLAVQRVADLNVHSRVVLLDALQQMPLAACPGRAELWVRNVILWTKGDELTELKTLCDLKGDVHSLHRLVYHDISQGHVRREILKHIQREASVHAAHRLLSTRISRLRSARRGDRKVLSDIDDTLMSSGGVYPAGIDRRWPRKAVYPGVLAFFRELDLGAAGERDGEQLTFAPSAPSGRLGNLVFLSARPHVFGDLAERSSYAKFTHLLQSRRLHAMPTMLTGDLKTGGEMMLRGDMEPLAQKKAQNFLEFQSLYPDTSSSGPGGLRRVGLAAKLDFELVQWEKNDRRIDYRRVELDDALRRCNRVLVKKYGLDPVPLCEPTAIPSSPYDQRPRTKLPAPGSAVRTPFGGGILLRSRKDGVAEVALDWRLQDNEPAYGFFNASAISTVSKSARFFKRDRSASNDFLG